MPYSTEAVRALWSDSAILLAWSAVETTHLSVLADEGLVPPEWAEAAREAQPPQVEAWRAETTECGHEVVGFLRAWGLEHVHIGLTSSDVTDTALGWRIGATSALISTQAGLLRASLEHRARTEAQTERLARTHGQAAVPDTAGHLFAGWADQTRRCLTRLGSMHEQIAVGKISGPAGGYLTPATTPEIEREVLRRLHLAPVPVSSQIVPRDAWAAWSAELATLASVCEAIALEVRLGSHSGVREILEGHHGRARVGSSAMPHKHNPTDSERVCGLARLARAAVAPLMEGVPQWHDRDMAHSSVERVLWGQLAGVVAYSLEQTTRLVDGLAVDRDRMAAALEAAGADARVHSTMTRLQLEGVPYAAARQRALAHPDEQIVEPRHFTEQPTRGEAR